MKNILSQSQISEIKRICVEYSIWNYEINNDGSIDVDGDVNIQFKSMTRLPLKFNTVTGDFNCYRNKLTTLEGSPGKVGGNVFLNDNRLTSLVGGPSEVGSDYECCDNGLITLEGLPKIINGDLTFCGNSVTTLIGSPEIIKGKFDCTRNQLTSLEHLPKILGDVYIYNNPFPKIFLDYFFIVDIEDEFIYPERIEEDLVVFLKYQDQFDVWRNGFNEVNFNDLISDIQEGLR